MLFSVTIDTVLGPMTAYASADGLCCLEFCSSEGRHKFSGKLTNREVVFETNPHLQTLERELNEYFDGTRKIFTVALIPSGTQFQKLVWQKLLEIPFGETRTYHQQSQQLGNTLAIRAVAAANGQNPIAILIPCHRVIGANGNLTGYAGGLQRKKWLLDHERKYSGQAIQGSLFD